MTNYHCLTPQQRAQLVEERLARGYPPHSPPHPLPHQTHYLVTCACYQHASHMNSAERRRQVLYALFATFTREGLGIRAWVILPNHYHLLVELDVFAHLGRCFRRVHGPTAREWNLEEEKAGRKVWYHFSDRAIRTERHYFTTLNYIHFNPVKHGLAASPYAWAESSVDWYLQRFGRAWLRDLWARHPLRSYGGHWDDY